MAHTSSRFIFLAFVIAGCGASGSGGPPGATPGDDGGGPGMEAGPSNDASPGGDDGGGGGGGAGGDAGRDASPPPSRGACNLPVVSDPDVQQALPKTFLDTTYVAPTGKTIAVAAGGDLQAAINSAQPGDVVAIAAGASFTGPFTLPNKSGGAAGYVTIRTDAPDAKLPPAGTRVDPSFANVMPKLLAPNAGSAIVAATGAHHYRFIGVEVAPTDASALVYELVELGAGTETTQADLPHDIILDRVYVHGLPTATVKRGVQLNGAATAVIDSYVADIHVVGQDAQALGGWNGVGPFKIVNNYLEASTEIVLFGGADAVIPNAVSSDIEIRSNHFYKPLTWKMGDPSYGGTHWAVKNLLEFKNAQRVLVQCNVFENNWADAQVGFSILLTPRNQDGSAPWSVVRDVTIQDNIVRHAASGFNVSGEDDNHPSQETQGVVIRNNLVYDLDATKWGGDGRIWQVITPNRPTLGIKIQHNTAFVLGNAMLTMGDTTVVADKLFFLDNLASHASYGIFGSGQGEGTAALQHFAPGYTVVKDVIIGGGTASAYPPNNFFPATPADVGFVDYAGGDYHLAASSPYKNAASDGKDIGADVSAILAATKGVAE